MRVRLPYRPNLLLSPKLLWHSHIAQTVMKKSVDLDIFDMTFDAKVTFENNHRSVSRAAFRRFSILKSWRVFHDQFLCYCY